MSTLIDTLAAHLPAGAVRCATPVDGIFPIDHQRWLVAIGGEHPRMLPVDGVIVATPAQATARIVEHVDQGVADDLRRVEYAGSAVVSLAYERSQIGHPLNALGFVVPLIEERMILSCSFSSVKYRGRAPSGTVLLRVFIGGANQSGLLRLPRQQLLDLAEREVADLLQIRGAPLLRHAARRAMPQYPVGHLNNIARIDARLQRFPTLALAGSALYGVGIPNCVQSGESAAERVASHLHSSTTFHRSLALAFKETVG
jgi:oxygen-dependent protoporphyrinogen oxidase